MSTQTADYAMSRTLAVPYNEADRRARSELAKEGFGILTEIDVQATLAAKLGVNTRPYEILGACNPALAYKAITSQPETGLLLPCNVVIRSPERDKETIVEILDPIAQLSLTDNPEVRALAEEARARLTHVLQALSNGEQ